MTRGTRSGRALFWFGIAAAALLLVEVFRHDEAVRGLDRAEQGIDSLASDASAVLRLRVEAPKSEWNERKASDLIALVNGALDAEQLPASAFDSLSQEGTRAASDKKGARRQSVRVVLAGLSLEELGRFLARWTTDQPLWSVASVDLSRQAAAASAPGSRGIRCTLVLSALVQGEA